MKKCKNVECENSVDGGRTYCSLKCRNYYVNKYLRDYSKNGIGLSAKTIEKYENNPKFCKNPNCGKKIEYNKRINDYCNNSCSASVTNVGIDRKNQKISSSAYQNILNSNRKKRGEHFIDYSFCRFCGTGLDVSNRVKFCSEECRKKHKRVNMDEYKKYKSDAKFNFNLADYPDEFDFKLIEEYGWYKPTNKGDNLKGVSRDHMLSVREGFDLGVDPKLISHPANCKLMIHTQNISKNKKSTISVEQLIDMITEWDKKYKNQKL